MAEVEEWVDETLDMYEAWRQESNGRSWSSYLHEHRFRRPHSITMFNVDDLRDAIVWLYDGGMSHRNIATTVALGDTLGIKEVLERAGRRLRGSVKRKEIRRKIL